MSFSFGFGVKNDLVIATSQDSIIIQALIS